MYDEQDRLRSKGNTSYAYSERGTLYQRLSPGGLETFTYDAAGNLIRREHDGLPTIEYTIDPQGRRVGKHKAGSLEKQYIWSSALRIAAELDGTGAVTQRFIYGNKVNVPDLIVRFDGVEERLYRVITDHLGSPVYVVNIAAPFDVLLDASYDEWGKVTAYTSSTGSWPIPFGFAGGLYDEDTKLVRFGVRDYDPAIGRWTAKDPIRWEGGQANLYVYVGNSPVNGFDPAGLETWQLGFSVEACYGICGSINPNIAWDDKGNLSFNLSASYGGASNIGAGAGITFEQTNADNVDALQGFEEYIGVGVSVGAVYGSAEYVRGVDGSYDGYALELGLGWSFLPVEARAGFTVGANAGLLRSQAEKDECD